MSINYAKKVKEEFDLYQDILKGKYKFFIVKTFNSFKVVEYEDAIDNISFHCNTSYERYKNITINNFEILECVENLVHLNKVVNYYVAEMLQDYKRSLINITSLTSFIDNLNKIKKFKDKYNVIISKDVKNSLKELRDLVVNNIIKLQEQEISSSGELIESL